MLGWDKDVVFIMSIVSIVPIVPITSIITLMFNTIKADMPDLTYPLFSLRGNDTFLCYASSFIWRTIPSLEFSINVTILSMGSL